MVPDAAAPLAALNETSIIFLKTELGLANTFLDVADTTKLSEHRVQSHENALKAYRAILHFLPHTQLSTDEQLDFDQQLSELKDRLVLAGVEL